MRTLCLSSPPPNPVEETQHGQQDAIPHTITPRPLDPFCPMAAAPRRLPHGGQKGGRRATMRLSRTPACVLAQDWTWLHPHTTEQHRTIWLGEWVMAMMSSP